MSAAFAANVQSFTEMVRNSAGRRDFVVLASMECVWYREVQLNAERHAHRCERSVAGEVMENGSWVTSSAAWADMLLAWARDCAMRYTSVLGMLGNSPRCCYLRKVPGKSLVL